MNSLTYLGKDTAPYYKDVARSLELFANFKPKSDFHRDGVLIEKEQYI